MFRYASFLTSNAIDAQQKTKIGEKLLRTKAIYATLFSRQERFENKYNADHSMKKCTNVYPHSYTRLRKTSHV